MPLFGLLFLMLVIYVQPGELLRAVQFHKSVLGMIYVQCLVLGGEKQDSGATENNGTEAHPGEGARKK